MSLSLADIYLLSRNDPKALLIVSSQYAAGTIIVADKTARNNIPAGSRALLKVVAYVDTGVFVTMRFDGANTTDLVWQNDAYWTNLAGSGGGTTLTADELAAIQGSLTPGASNVFATVVQLQAPPLLSQVLVTNDTTAFVVGTKETTTTIRIFYDAYRNAVRASGTIEITHNGTVLDEVVYTIREAGASAIGITGMTVAFNGDDIELSIAVDNTLASNIEMRYSKQYILGYIPPPSMPATFGYFLGGTSGAVTATTNLMTFSTEVFAASTISNLSLARANLSSGITDTVNYGYVAGGYSSAVVATTDRITFSTNTTAANTVSNLPTATRNNPGLSDAVNYGYTFGGHTGALVVTANRITFSTGVFAVNTTSNLPTAKMYSATISDGSVNGYILGGNTNSAILLSEMIVFSTGATSSNTVSNLTLARHTMPGMSDGSTKGYVFGGLSASTTGATVTADMITFSTGVTTANTTSDLSAAKGAHGAISNGLTFGYISGGGTGTTNHTATTDRIVFATDVTSAQTSSNLTQGKSQQCYLSDGTV